jgi:hypothetical protein
VAGEPAGDRDGVGEDLELLVDRQQPGEPGGRGAGVEDDGAALGHELQRLRGDPVLLRGVGAVAVRDAGLEDGEGVRGNDAAVDAPDQPGPLERGEVASDRLSGDPVGVGELGDGHAPGPADGPGDGLLTFLGVHPTPLICVSVVLCPNVLTVKG